MSAMQYVRFFGILGPILGLFALGLVLTLRNGLVEAARGDRVRVAIANVSRTLVALAACLVGLAAVHRVVGLHMTLAW